LLSKTGTDLNTNEYDFSDKSGDDLELQIESTATSELGASVTVTPIANDAGVIVDQDLVDAAISTSSDAATLTRSLGYKQVHTITLTQSTVPFKARVTVQDKANLSLGETYIISSIGRYPESGEKPVKVAGIYWAPTNVGATEFVDSYSAGTTAQMTTARVGYYFQWGRTNAPFENTLTHDTHEGPITVEEHEAGTYADEFILTDNDWLDTQDDNLWSGQGPCPPGWRVPTIADFTAAFSNTTEPGQPNYLTYQISSSKVVVVSGDVPETSLVVPVAGNLNGNNGTEIQMIGSSAYLWTTTPGSGDAARMSRDVMIWAYDVILTNATTRRHGHSVRCVLDGVQEDEE
jgi:uncharacterized protein (TIGR02145 family)